MLSFKRSFMEKLNDIMCFISFLTVGVILSLGFISNLGIAIGTLFFLISSFCWMMVFMYFCNLFKLKRIFILINGHKVEEITVFNKKCSVSYKFEIINVFKVYKIFELDIIKINNKWYFFKIENKEAFKMLKKQLIKRVSKRYTH